MGAEANPAHPRSTAREMLDSESSRERTSQADRPKSCWPSRDGRFARMRGAPKEERDATRRRRSSRSREDLRNDEERRHGYRAARIYQSIGKR
jgi:hypothetical protein